MKKIAILIFAAILTVSFQTGNMCDTKKLKETAKKELEPYKYDLSKLTRITYKKTSQLKETEVRLFIGEKYRLIFNTEALPKTVVISLYNRDKESSKRKLLFTTKDAPADKKIFSFEYSWANKIFVDYEIPADSSAQELTGCAFFMLGYK